MKKTRRAAAVWMTMSLALSTIFGNTAWGEVLQETGGNRCTHVHTAECYGDLDETATPSQIGDLEPAKCTHVCSEETGCIQNTKNGEVLSTPSNAYDSTVNPGTSTADDSTVKPGTTTRVDTQTKTKNEIHSWTWYDPEEILIGGKLELTGVTEEAQPSFEEVTEYLPQAIIAQVGNSDVWEEKNLQIANWTCAEYVQDEKGRWPLEGNYEFTAELPDGYELADGVDALVVEVSVAGDQTAMAGAIRILSVYGANGGKQEDLNWDGSNYSGTLLNYSAWNNGIRVTHTSGNSFILELTDINMGNIYIADGDWTVVLNGENYLDGKGTYASGIAFWVHGGSATIIEGNGAASLDVNADFTKNGSCGIEVETNLTINSGNITSYAKAGSSSGGSTGAIYVTQNGTLNIVGGSVTATGEGKYGLSAYGMINMTGGNFKVVGVNKVGVAHEANSTFTFSGGTVDISAATSDGRIMTGMVTKGNLKITGQVMKVKILSIVRTTTVVEKGGKLETEGIRIENGNLENNGILVANGNFEDHGGTISGDGTFEGNGTLPANVRKDPGGITISNPKLSWKYKEEEINISELAGVKKPNDYVKLVYSIDENNSTGTGTIDPETGKLTVKKAGIFKIKVNTTASGVYTEGIPVTITLTVEKADFPATWNLKVVAVNNIYNGSSGYPAAEITENTIPKDVNVEYRYQLADVGSNWDPDKWETECPIVVNTTDSYKKVFVQVVTDNYKSTVFSSSNLTSISRREFSSRNVKVTIDQNNVAYNGQVQTPEIKVVESWQGTVGNKLIKDVDYRIYRWSKENGSPASAQELKDVGTYTVFLMGIGNYDDSVMTATFTIEKCKLEPDITGSDVIKFYDGTSDVMESQGLKIILKPIEGAMNSADDIHVDSVDWSYRGTDAGVCYIDAKNITLAGKDVGNYKLTKDYDEIRGEIVRRKFDSINVSSTPLIYNGTVQKAQIDASVNTGLDKVSGSNAKFFYSIDDEKFDSEVPSFKDAGTYTVHVKAEMDNFNEIKKDVEVVVKKAAALTVTGLSETYSYKETGEKRVKFTGIPEDCGTLGAVTAQIVSDEGQIIDGSPTVDGSEVVFKLKGSSREMIGKTAQIVVTVETQNYENIEIPVAVTLKADPSDSDSENGSSSSDDSDYNDSKTTAPKLSDVRSGNAANSAANNVTKDSKKGYWSNAQGIITGADNQVTNDGYSHWIKDSRGWWLRYSDGSYPKGSAGEYHWEKINGRWWAFGAGGYLSTGWIYDTFYQGWFYMDANQGMLTGWQFIDGKWYYLNPVSDGTSGIMYAKKRTPDGWLVKEDGSWDEEAGR